LIRIGLVCHSSLGGSGVIATELGDALAARGHQVHFFCAEAPARLRSAELHLVKSPVHALFPGGEYALALASALADAGPSLDLIHVHYAIPLTTSAWLARQMQHGRGPKLITTLHGTDVLTLGRDPALQPVIHASLRACDALSVPTRYLHDEVKKTFALDAEVISNFVDTARFKPAAHPRGTLIHNSNFRPLKRVDDVVRVFAAVQKQIPSAKLVLVGDGPTRADVEKLVKALNLSGAITFAGEQDDVLPYLQPADVFLFPSQTESFGLAALEALSCGVPVVASNTGGLPELIDDGQTGFLRSVGDVPAMADAAVRLLTDDALYRRMSAAARESAETRWRAGPQVDHYEALYRRVL
jgi:N-acetyl-alpha-D-glucosaminyl L-malate synthase BshA